MAETQWSETMLRLRTRPPQTAWGPAVRASCELLGPQTSKCPDVHQAQQKSEARGRMLDLKPWCSRTGLLVSSQFGLFHQHWLSDITVYYTARATFSLYNSSFVFIISTPCYTSCTHKHHENQKVSQRLIGVTQASCWDLTCQAASSSWHTHTHVGRYLHLGKH